MNLTNHDPVNLEHFAKLADYWWDSEGPCKTLHHINPTRLEYIQMHAKLSKQTVLDVGCGAGILSEALARTGVQVTALDLNDELIQVAKEHAGDLLIDYHASSAEAWVDQGLSYDIVTCMELLEHVPCPEAIIQACARLLKPGGLLFLSTLTRSLRSYLEAIVAGEYLFKLIPVGTHSYQQFIKPHELAQLCREAGLELRDVQGLNYQPVKKTATLKQRIGSNYICVVQRTHD